MENINMLKEQFIICIYNLSRGKNNSYYLWEELMSDNELVRSKVDKTIKLLNEGNKEILNVDIETELWDFIK